MEILKQLYQSILKGNAPDTEKHSRRALEENVPLQDIISKGMNAAMEEVGVRFSRNELFLPEMMVAARAMKAGMGVLEPYIVAGSKLTRGKIVLGTVRSDLHDVGKNLVAMMFKGSGFDVIDIGVDVPKEKFLESIQKESPEFLGVSALLTTTLPNVIETLAFLRSSGVGGKCKILVGGAPVTEEFAKRAGADGYAPDAGSAVQLAKSMLQR